MEGAFNTAITVILTTTPSEVTAALPLQRNAGFKRLSTLDVNVKTTNSTWPPKVTVTVWLLSVESNTNGNADNWDGMFAALSGNKKLRGRGGFQVGSAHSLNEPAETQTRRTKPREKIKP